MTSSSFPDHFSRASSAYAAFRPRYPLELFTRLAERSPARRTAWDAATGSGQAALGLALYFDQVWATDASAAQVAAATPHPRVRYEVSRAEASGLPPRSIDLVTVAQALHWFDRPAFYEEVRRVLVSGGLLAAWSYDLMNINPAIDELVHHFYTHTVGAFWPPERALVEARYRTIEFPFDEIEMPALHIEADLDLHELAGYMRTWSSVLRFREATQSDPVAPLIEAVQPRWGPAETSRRVRWPLSIRAGYAEP